MEKEWSTPIVVVIGFVVAIIAAALWGFLVEYSREKEVLAFVAERLREVMRTSGRETLQLRLVPSGSGKVFMISDLAFARAPIEQFAPPPVVRLLVHRSTTPFESVSVVLYGKDRKEEKVHSFSMTDLASALALIAKHLAE